MAIDNLTRIRREIFVRMALLFFSGKKFDELDRIPIEMRPKDYSTTTRCCIYRDRAIIKYRVMAAMGIGVEDEADELTSLASYAKLALEKDSAKQEKPLLTVLAQACSRCVSTGYEITNACRGCAGRFCASVCPKDAIRIKDSRAYIDQEKCIKCGKCQKACPFSAIIRNMAPCQNACPVGAITRTQDGAALIDHEKCIACGKCLSNCPFSAIMERSNFLETLEAISNPKIHTTAIIAPSLANEFNASLGAILAGVKKIGFDEVQEVAAAAENVAKEEAAEFKEKVLEGKQEFMTNSCCPGSVELAKKHLPEMLNFISDTPSPMEYAARYARKQNNNSRVIFIGPCLAKRVEARQSEYVDHVMTFEQLTALLLARDIELDNAVEISLPEDIAKGRGFAKSGGVTAALKSYLGNETFTTEAIDGLDKKNISKLKLALSGKIPLKQYYEIMACSGGCVNGPCTI